MKVSTKKVILETLNTKYNVTLELEHDTDIGY